MRNFIMCLLLVLAAPAFGKAVPVRPVAQPATVWDLVRVGMTRAQVREVYHLDRLDPDTDVRSSTNTNASARFWFNNAGATVSEILVTVSRTSPDELGVLLSERYGKPASSRLVELAPSMSRNPGERATRLFWRRGLITITLDQPLNPVYSSYSEVIYTVHDPSRGELPL